MNSIGRLRWQCRRGTLELDILLEKYLDDYFEAADSDEKRTFKELLQLEDEELLSYLMGERTPATEDFARIIKKIIKGV